MCVNLEQYLKWRISMINSYACFQLNLWKGVYVISSTLQQKFHTSTLIWSQCILWQGLGYLDGCDKNGRMLLSWIHTNKEVLGCGLGVQLDLKCEFPNAMLYKFNVCYNLVSDKKSKCFGIWNLGMNCGHTQIK